MKAPREIIESDERLVEFLRASESVGCTEIVARQLVEGEPGQAPVATFELEGSEDDEDTKHFNAETINSRLMQDAEGIGGIQKYILHSFRPNSKTPRDRLVLPIDGGVVAGAIEVTSDKGASLELLKQAHGHIERMSRGFTNALSMLCGSIAKQTEMLESRLEKTQEQNVELWGIVREYQTIDRDKITLEARVKEDSKRNNVLNESMELAAKGVIHKMLPSPESKKAVESTFIKSLDDKQRAAIFNILTPEQQLLIGGVIEEAIADESKKETKEKAETQENG